MNLFVLIVLALIAFGLGGGLLLAGYRFFLLLLPIWGFAAGFWLGAELIAVTLDQGFMATITGVIVAVTLGLLMAVLAYYFYAWGVLLLGASFGYWLAVAILYILNFEPGFIVTVIGVIAAIVFATLTVMLDVKKHLLIIMTSFGGSWGIIFALLLVIGIVNPSQLQDGAARGMQSVIDDSVLWLIAWLVIAIAGIIIQENTNKHFFLEYDRQYGS